MTLFFYCQHSVGMGHLVRSSALAERLATTFDVVFLNGGAVPAGVPFPPIVERVDLPPIGMRGNSLVSLTPSLTVEQALQARRDRMIRLLDARRPDAMLVELFPFGRKKFEPELIPLLEAARAYGSTRPLIVCSLRDLLVTARRNQQDFDDRAQSLCDRYVDLVLVHADSTFATLEESFRPSLALRTPVAYTGFMTRSTEDLGVVRERRGVLVSAGGGQVGEPLFRAAIAAHDINWPALHLPTTIVAGPFAPSDVVEDLQVEAGRREGLVVLPSVPSLAPLLAGARASVSQCGYNTALDLLRARVPALVVPFSEGRENEQTERAERLTARGLLRTRPSAELGGATLAADIRSLLSFEPPATGLQMNGGDVTLNILTARVEAWTGCAPSSALAGGPR